MTFIVKQNITKRLSVWAAVVALILMVALVAMQFTDEVAWDETDFTVVTRPLVLPTSSRASGAHVEIATPALSFAGDQRQLLLPVDDN